MKQSITILLAAVLAVIVFWFTRQGSPSQESQAPDTGGDTRPDLGKAEPRVAVDPPKDVARPPDRVPPVVGSSEEEEARNAENAQQRRQRLEKLIVQGRGWVQALQRTLDLSPAQVESMEGEMGTFASELEAIFWRQGEEFDRETAVARLYEKWDGRLAGHLSTLQREGFGGLPRDWGFGLTTPGGK
ncbi:MAG: hypothetical protein HUU15_06635 [Candidatus Brocadiae bacterium]|nr:hypothetical protein [Candidatus Brocadiia bacterium]